MTAFNRVWGILPALTLIGGLGTASVAMAQTTPSTASEDAGATTGLGTHHRFPSVAAAQQHCPGDTIVWSNGKGLTYHVVSSDSSSSASHGFYACKMEADSAGFQPAN
jgi:plastocyanin